VLTTKPPRLCAQITALTTKPLGGGEEAHRRWPEGRSERAASKAKQRPPVYQSSKFSSP